ncbi:hypothetical protein D3C71_1571040 [compost metagenome]
MFFIEVTMLSPKEESEPPTMQVFTNPLFKCKIASCNASKDALHPQVNVLEIPFNLK